MILFVHGWGYDASFWDLLRQELGDVPSTALDLGYFGADATTIPPDVTLLVGHSLGCSWLLRQPSLRSVPLIGINAFPRFSEADDFKPAVAPRLLDRMTRRLAMDARGVLAEFWQRAGAPGPDKALEIAALTEGLRHLAAWDERESLVARASAVRLIAGEEDAIVPPAMTRMAFKDRAIDWLPGGHALPRTHPTEIARMIRS